MIQHKFHIFWNNLNISFDSIKQIINVLVETENNFITDTFSQKLKSKLLENNQIIMNFATILVNKLEMEQYKESVSFDA